MKFGQPLLTTELSGSIGGATASSARGSVNYFRVRRRPSNPRSAGQTLTRFIMTGLAGAWRGTLTDAYRAGWAALAGDESSGIDAYVRGNAVAMLAGNPRVDVPPTAATMNFGPIVTDPVVDASDHNITVTIPTDWEGEARAAIFISAPQKASRLSRENNFLYAGATPTSSTGAEVVSIPATHPAYNAITGQIVYVRIVPFPQSDGINTGKTGQAQEFRVTVQA